jgi:hypothetical protein
MIVWSAITSGGWTHLVSMHCIECYLLTFALDDQDPIQEEPVSPKWSV